MCHWRTTPSHGWLLLSPRESAQIPDYCRRPDYEEDCEWSIAVTALPDLARQISFDARNDPNNPRYDPTLAAKDIAQARETCRNWYPDIYEKLTGETTTPENSYKRREEHFNRENAKNLVVVSACGEWCGCPAGYVECVATLGGDHHIREGKKFYVLAARYETREEFGYVIQPDDLAA
jgi:hypothetical protein